jgi:hypothetical protein
MGRFSYELLQKAVPAETLAKYSTIVETGTLFGDGAELMSKHFKTVHTIEIQDSLYEKAKARFQGNPGIQCHNGDSVDVLAALAPTLATPTVFFLDAHWSGDSSVDWVNSEWKGYTVNTGYRGTNPIDPKNQNPLLEEIDILVKTVRGEFILYVDDTEKFDAAGNGLRNRCFIGEDWTHLSLQKLEATLGTRLVSKHKTHDQIVYIVSSQ